MKVLVADDSAVLRSAITKLLEPIGYEVIVAADGVEAITRFYSDRPDLLLLETSMPKLNGYVVCRLIKEDPAASRTPVLMLTARSITEDRFWAAKSGADGYLTKDALGAGLLSTIRTTLAARALSDLTRGPEAPIELGETDVLALVCEMLDRKLFEATVVNEITSVGMQAVDMFSCLEQTLASVCRLVAYDLAAVALVAERCLAVRAEKIIESADLAKFQALTIGRLGEITGTALEPDDMTVWRLDDWSVGDHQTELGWPSFDVIPLHAHGHVFGVLALGAQRPDVFTETVQSTMRHIGAALASVLDSARQYQRVLEQEARNTLSSLGA
ncbi:MAG: response regulator [Acidimicrobiia bacterium]